MALDDRERALARRVHDLQMELFAHQGDEIEALRKAIESLRRSHEIAVDIIRLTGELIDPRDH